MVDPDCDFIRRSKPIETNFTPVYSRSHLIKLLVVLLE